MLVIGLTGRIGSGKTTVANLFAKQGVPIVDADVIARTLTQPGTSGYQAIVEHFGNSVLNDDLTLNRAALRDIIFTNPHEREWLERLLHPQILSEMQTTIHTLQAPYCLAVIPLLLETDAVNFVNRILVVDIPEATQLERASKRDNAPKENIKAIINTQINRNDSLARADDIINNAGTTDELAKQVIALHQQYLQMGRSSTSS